MGDKDRIEVKIAHIAGRQQRQVTREQLLAAGMAPTSITRWCRVGRLYRVHRGVYSVGAPPITHLELAMAAVLACGPAAVLSHGSALTLWGVWKRRDRPFEVIVRADRRPKGIRVHRHKLDQEDITRHLGIPVTTLARTALDRAGSMPLKSLNRAINTGRQNRQLRLEELAAVLRRYPLHPGGAKLRAVLGLSGRRPTRSGFEDDFVEFCRKFGLPIPEMNTIVAGHEVDALFVEERVIVELDSWLFHSSRTSFEDDRRRDADTLLADHVTVRLTDRRFDAPAELAADLHALLAGRRNYTGPPWPVSGPTRT